MAILLVALLLLGGATAFWLDGPPDNSADQRSNEQEPENKEPHNEGADSSPSDPHASLTLNDFGQRDDGTVYANATVDDMREGTCDFRFSRGGSHVIKTTDIERTPTGYYACGIRMEASELTPRGEWQLQVSLPGAEPLITSDAKEAMIK